MIGKVPAKDQRRKRRKRGLRYRITGLAGRPRLTVFRSLNHIYAQIVDDESGKTVASSSSVKLKIKGGNIEAAKQVGKALAEAAKSASVSRVCFDRNGRLFHGRVKALADAAREAGLDF